MDFDNNIGSLSVFTSKSGQGKSFAMLYHALKNGRDFVYLSQEIREDDNCRRFQALIQAYSKERNLFTPYALFKHIPDPEQYRKYLDKVTMTDVYIDSPEYFYKNPYESFELMCGKHVYVTQHSVRNFENPLEEVDHSLISSNDNLLKKYFVYKENNCINVTGSENYRLDINVIQSSFLIK